MSDQNQFDQYKQKLLHYWGLFLAALGRFWEKVKIYSSKAAAVIRRNAVVLGQKLTEFGTAAGVWLQKAWTILCRYAKRLVQILATWLLLAREKCEPALVKAKAWLVSVRERLPKKEAQLPAPEEPRALPVVQENIVDAEAAEPVEVTAEPVRAAAEVPAESESAPVEKKVKD